MSIRILFLFGVVVVGRGVGRGVGRRRVLGMAAMEKSVIPTPNLNLNLNPNPHLPYP